ncbi:MAG: hypothetical protein Q7J06_11270 [Bacteroidales bacterium]|nr:hypothetical protein [Bacteroidales bacterium]
MRQNVAGLKKSYGERRRNVISPRKRARVLARKHVVRSRKHSGKKRNA